MKEELLDQFNQEEDKVKIKNVLRFIYSEKAIKIWPIFHFLFDII